MQTNLVCYNTLKNNIFLQNKIKYYRKLKLIKFVLHDLPIETTRRCNIKCDHCMRGLSQNVDITPEIIDMIFGKEEIVKIDKICFSGGDPRLNPYIIIYTINKIIEENINVDELVMVTNGQILSKEFEYNLERLKYFKEGEIYTILDNIYVIATGYVTSEGMWQYFDMDRINLEYIYDVLVSQMLEYLF